MPETYQSTYNEAPNTQGTSKWKPSNHSYPGNNSSSHFNSSKPRWKPIKSYNKTQDSAYNHFNQSHVGWKPQNKTISNPSTTGPIYKHETGIASHYYSFDESTTASTIRRGKIVPDGVFPPWAKPDTNPPSVSIDDDINNESYSDEHGIQTDEDKIHQIIVEPIVNKYDVDILDETDSWKPRLVFENKTKKDDNSVIMSVNKKSLDVDIFDVEMAPWQERK